MPKGHGPRAERTAVRRHRSKNPLYEGKEKGVWHPDLVGKVRAYPKSQEAFDKRRNQCIEQLARLQAEGKMGRRGVSDGWGGRKAQAIAARAAAHELGKKVARIMVEKGLVPKSDDDRLELAMAFTAGLILDPTAVNREKLSAAKTLIDALKGTKQNVTVNTAEDFLRTLAGEKPTA